MDEPGETFCVVLVTARADLLEWPALDALYEVGCSDATIGHDLLEFTWSAASRGQTLRPVLRDVELVAGVSVERIEFAEGSAGRR